MPDRRDLVPALEAAQVRRGLQLWWFGGPSYAVKSPEALIYVDPFHCGPRADDPQGFRRAIPNYLFPDTVTHADLVLSTHNHIDHCDPDTLRPLYSLTSAQFVAAPSAARLMAEWGFGGDRLIAMTPGERLQIADVTITAHPSRDWEDTEAVTFILSSGGVELFVGGDTLYTEALSEIGSRHRIDLAVLALARNHRDVIDQELYLDPAGIARAARALGARRVLPVHWDIWEGWREDPQLVAEHLAGSETELVVLAQGDTFDVLPR